ncbi:MAG TPA: hypothetical protein VK949_00660 [Methylotenera sp.]|nr:hypothetical protein [Methylotenera sp.]
MIQIIGIMIGAYLFTRMAELISKEIQLMLGASLLFVPLSL